MVLKEGGGDLREGIIILESIYGKSLELAFKMEHREKRVRDLLTVSVGFFCWRDFEN